jgi:DnaJ-class molecular chaperone
MGGDPVLDSIFRLVRQRSRPNKRGRATWWVHCAPCHGTGVHEHRVCADCGGRGGRWITRAAYKRTQDAPEPGGE